MQAEEKGRRGSVAPRLQALLRDLRVRPGDLRTMVQDLHLRDRLRLPRDSRDLLCLRDPGHRLLLRLETCALLPHRDLSLCRQGLLRARYRTAQDLPVPLLRITLPTDREEHPRGARGFPQSRTRLW